MCNFYAQTKSQDAMRQVFRDVLEEDEELIDAAGNLAPVSGIFPDYAAPIIRRSEGRDWTLTTARSTASATGVFGHRRSREADLTDRKQAAPAGGRGR